MSSNLTLKLRPTALMQARGLLMRHNSCMHFRALPLACLIAAASAAYAQSAAPPAHPVRPAPPTRSPHEPGYVQATELPDGAVPAADHDGNFILGPTHKRASEIADASRALDGKVIEFTMNSADSKYFPGIERSGDYRTATPIP